MSEEIVRRLRSRNKKNIDFLKESLSSHSLHEADEDEEVDTPEEDIPSVEEAPEEEDNSGDNEDYVDPEGDTEKEEKNSTGDDESTEYVNPLDNAYAVKYTIGDEVLLAYSNGTSSKLKGEIDGYDKEGFYRIKWSNGLTTNGITDLALSDLVSPKHENKCVCGNTKFVTEGKYVVCDTCGRRIKESNDPLTLADKSRPKGKKLIRSEAHPVSTAIKPAISESIRKAFKGSIKGK